MGQHETSEIRNTDSETSRLSRHVGDAEQYERNALARSVLPMPFYGCDLSGLMLEGVEAVLVSDQDL